MTKATAHGIEDVLSPVLSESVHGLFELIGVNDAQTLSIAEGTIPVSEAIVKRSLPIGFVNFNFFG